MNKKGFTLVELLAVIAILAILVIIALPNVLGMFRQAKENTFVEEVQKIYQTATTEYISGSMNTTKVACFSSEKNPLDLTGRSTLKYYIKFDNEGKVVNVQAYDDSYQLNIGLTDVAGGITIEQIGSGNSGKKYTVASRATGDLTKCE